MRAGIRSAFKIAYIAFFELLISTHPGFTQFSENYFSDNEPKESGQMHASLVDSATLIVGGSSFDKIKNMAFIARYDTLGNTIWSTSNDTSSYDPKNKYIDLMMLSSDGNVYATCFNGSDQPKEIWKVNAFTGQVMWRHDFDSYSYTHPEYIIDYDSSSILIGYRDDYNGSTYSTDIAFVSKQDGAVVSTHHITDLLWSRDNYGLAIDHDKNIYYTKYDSIFKVSGVDPSQVLWKVRYASPNIWDFQQIYVDENDSVFLFGNNNGTFLSGKVVALGKSNGSLLWTAASQSGDAEFSNMADHDGSLFVTWKHIYVGGDIFNWWTTKVDKASGTVQWNSSYSFTGLGFSMGNAEAALSMNVDSSGDVYLTGYYGDSNYGPANWGILKLDGSNGNSLYEATITEDSAICNSGSEGKRICLIDSKIYCAGNLQTEIYNGYTSTKITLVKIDPQTGNTLYKKYLAGTYQFPSSTLRIENYHNSKTVVLKQVGRFTQLELYDFDKNLLWEKQFISEYILFAKNISVTHDGVIILTAYCTKESDTDPYYVTSFADSILIFRVDSSGNTLNRFSIATGSYSFPIETVNDDNNNSFIFYHKSNTIYCTKISSGVLSAEHSLGITYYIQPGIPHNAIDVNSSTILYFGSQNYQAKVIKVDKSTLTCTIAANIPFINYIYYALRQDENKVLICGPTTYELGMLMCYDITNYDTLWKKTYGMPFIPYQLAYDPDSSHVFIAGHSGYDERIKKVSALDGSLLWSYENNDYEVLPQDMKYQYNKDRLVITGDDINQQGPDLIQKVFIDILDTSGVPVIQFTKTGAVNTDNTGLCVGMLADESVWVGGNIHDASYGKAGFIFQVDSCDQPQVFYADADSDGYGNANDSILSCSVPLGYVLNNGDCDDTNPNIHPGAVEIVGNNIDDDCDGLIDEICSVNFTLVADTLIPHHYWLISDATGVPPINYLWNWGDGTTDTSAYPSHTYDSAGFYNICLSIVDSNGCSDTSCVGYELQKSEQQNTIITVDVVDSIPIATAIQNASVLQSWSVFPNPVSENLFINYDLSIPATVTTQLHDVLGNKLLELNKNESEGEHYSVIILRKLSNGIYYLQLRVNSSTVIQKIVVTH